MSQRKKPRGGECCEKKRSLGPAEDGVAAWRGWGERKVALGGRLPFFSGGRMTQKKKRKETSQGWKK